MNLELIKPAVAIVMIYGLVALAVFLSYRSMKKESKEKLSFFKWLTTKKDVKE